MPFMFSGLRLGASANEVAHGQKKRRAYNRQSGPPRRYSQNGHVGLDLHPMILRPFFFIGAAMLTACSSGPSYRPKSAADLGVPESWSVDAAPGQPQLTQWWNNFQDPALTRLIDDAASANLDVAQAVARLRQAREALVISRSDLFPSIGASAGYSRSETLKGARIRTGDADSFSAGLDASYQVDLFGGTRSAIRASRADYEAATFDYATVLLSVESEVARNYVLARAYQALLDNARASLAIQQDNLEIAGFRVQAGLVSSIDQEQARASAAQTAAAIPGIEEQYNAALSRLGVLTGQAPGAVKPLLSDPRPIPQGPQEIAPGIPADILRQRPDVRAAERTLAAATADIGVARAQLFPALSIGGSIDSNAGALKSLFDTVTGNIFATLGQAIFDAGRRGAQVRASKAAAEGALAAYKLTVLQALEDVENAIIALDAARERERQYAIAHDAALASAQLARSQYRSGLTDFTTLNTQEAALISARNGLVQARSDKATALIGLYVSLGGGWGEGAPHTAPVKQQPDGK